MVKRGKNSCHILWTIKIIVFSEKNVFCVSMFWLKVIVPYFYLRIYLFIYVYCLFMFFFICRFIIVFWSTLLLYHFFPQPVTKSLYFQLQCTGPSGAYSSLPFLITISDVNDHAPAFQAKLYETSISEFHSVGLPIMDSMRASDTDLPNTPNTELHFAVAVRRERPFNLWINGFIWNIVIKKWKFVEKSLNFLFSLSVEY